MIKKIRRVKAASFALCLVFFIGSCSDQVRVDNSFIIATYDDAVYNGILAVEVAKNMHSIDTANYYSASVEVTFSPVLIDGGDDEPTEIGIWSSDSVSTEDEFDFDGA